MIDRFSVSNSSLAARLASGKKKQKTTTIITDKKLYLLTFIDKEGHIL